VPVHGAAAVPVHGVAGLLVHGAAALPVLLSGKSSTNHSCPGAAQLIEDYRETAQGRQVLRLRYVTQARHCAPCIFAVIVWRTG
jgi:hypothetical protein